MRDIIWNLLIANRWFVVAIALGGLAMAPLKGRADSSPRLVIVISVDQWKYEYLDRFQAGRAEDGFLARVARGGTRYDQCHHGHAFTFTGPGHTVLLSGAFPNRSGVIGNAWFDRVSGKAINCVFDPQARIVGSVSANAGVSPRNLLAPTLGDALKLASGGRAKVLSVGFKDRAAVLTAGHLADGVYWFDYGSGNWVTSDAYRTDLPGYIRTLNEGRAATAYAGRRWELLLDESQYRQDRPDASPVEKPGDGLTAAFPHVLPAAEDPNYYRQLRSMPFANEYTLRTALEIIRGEGLGDDNTPDLLAINLAAPDYTGHHFGPFSREVEDMFYRTDRQLAEFLRELESLVGPDRWLIALSSDHGVAPIPEYAMQMGLKASRSPLGDLSDVREKLEGVLCAHFGLTAGDANRLVLQVESNQVYLAEGHPRLQGDHFAEAQRVVLNELLSSDAVVAAVTRDQLLASNGSGDDLFRMIYRAFHRDRSGDVLYVTAPYHVDAGDYSTSHGSPWSYDRHVPLLLLGADIPSGRFKRPVRPGDLAPTLAAILHIDAPAMNQHHVLHEVLPSP